MRLYNIALVGNYSPIGPDSIAQTSASQRNTGAYSSYCDPGRYISEGLTRE